MITVLPLHNYKIVVFWVQFKEGLVAKKSDMHKNAWFQMEKGNNLRINGLKSRH